MIGLISEYPDTGIELSGDRWSGARRVHCASDKYRVIWELDDDGDVVIVLLIGKKKQLRGTIYDLPRPEMRWQLDQE